MAVFLRADDIVPGCRRARGVKMADLNKKTMMTNEQMEAKLKSLHSKETKWKVLAICAFVMMFVIGFITGNVLLVLAFLVIMIVFSFFGD